MSEKKMVRRSVAIALGIICIALVAGLAGAFAYYVNRENNTISSLNTQISGKDTQISQLNTQISDQNNTISSLNSQLAILQNQTKNIHILGKENSTVWIDNETTNVQNDTHSWEFDNVSSAGYVLVLVSSNNNSTFVNVITYTLNGTLVDYGEVLVGFGGTAVFSVLPSWYVLVDVGNSFVEGTATITAIYCC
jgi:uncharacterized coiled-coil protein SlyX